MKKVNFLIAATMLHSLTALADESDTLKINRLQAVEIVSVRAGETTPVAHSDISRATIEQNNFGRDIPFVLSLTPSVTVTSDAGAGIGYTSFRIRGVDANRINVTANGVPLNDSESHGVFWVNMPDFASSLEDVQVQRGVGTSTNGAGAFGASVNMKTGYIPLEAYSEYNGSFGSFNTRKSTFRAGTGQLGDHFAFDARLSTVASDGFIDRAEVDLKSYFVQGEYFADKTLLKFITFSGKEKTYHAWDGVPDYMLAEGNRTYNPSGYMGDDADGNPLYYENQTDNYRQTHYQLSLVQTLSPALSLKAALHYTGGLGYYEEYKQRRSLEEYGLKRFVSEGETIKKSDLVRQKHLDNDFFGGVFSLDYSHDRLKASVGGGANRYDGNHFGRVIWVKNYATDPAFSPEHEYYRSRGEKNDANIFLKADYSLTGSLNAYADLQYRRIAYRINGQNDVWDWLNGEMQRLSVDETFNFFNPKAGLFYRFNPQHSAFGSVAVAHREPNRNNYTDAALNETPKAERLTDFELGYRFADSRFAFGLNAYYMLYRDQLVLNGKVNEIGEPLTSNVPDSYRAGVELTAGVTLLPCLRWDGNLTLSRNRIKNYTEYVTVYDADDNVEAEQQADFYGETPIACSPDLIANSLFSFIHKAFTAALQSAWTGRQFLDNTGRSDRQIDASFVNNLIAGYEFQLKGVKRLKLSVAVYNLFNEKYEPYGWLWSCYYRGADGSLSPYTEKSYFPQAGINFLANVGLKF
jgi:iron complex outermembrane receptor protein